MRWYVEVLKKYGVFSGRSRRREYWFFVLFNFIFTFVLSFIDHVAGLADSGYLTLAGLYALAVLVPAIAVGVRRLHDTDRSGWWLLIAFVPLIGLIVLIVFLVSDGQPGNNRFGPNPKEVAA